MSNTAGRFPSLALWERAAITALVVTGVVFGALIVHRTALRHKPKGDFGVYARAAWAVRAGDDLRAAKCDHGWHYSYPPTLAVLLAPLALPPRGIEGTSTLPFAVSCALWYLINAACLIVGVHTLVSALEHAAATPLLRQQPTGCRSWWQLRLWPVLACAPAVGQTLGRGQVNLILLALVCGFLAAMIRGQSFRAGVYIAGAICLKIIPAFLLLVPLWRRDRRCFLGCAVGLMAIGVAIPSCGLGLPGTLRDYGELYSIVIAPGLGYGQDERMAGELTSITCGHSQSLMSMVHTWLHPVRDARPTDIPAWTRLLHFAFAGGLLLTTLAAGLSLCNWRRRPGATGGTRSPTGFFATLPPLHGSEALRLTLFVGALMLTMIATSPMCHSHYLCLGIPLWTGLMLCDWQRHDSPHISRGLFGLMGVNVLACCAMMLPGNVLLADMGLGGMATLLAWGVGVASLWQLSGGASPSDLINLSPPHSAYREHRPLGPPHRPAKRQPATP